MTDHDPLGFAIRADRRIDDIVTVKQKAIDRALFLIVAGGATLFLYQLSEILARHSQWIDFQQPPGVAELVRALASGIAAILAALGLDVKRFFKGFGDPGV